LEELRVFISSESGVMALAVTLGDRSLARTFRAADEYSQLWRRHTSISIEEKKERLNNGIQ